MKRALAVVLLFSALGGLDVLAGDPAAARRQYQIARRLAVDGSAQAVEALRKVIELDPQGPLVDDALVDEASLYPVARWPERLGRIGPDGARQVVSLLDRVVREHPGGDRRVEAQYLRALVRLEPITGRDAPAARLDLVAAATSRPPSEWSGRARYALAWLNEQNGPASRALDAYQRVVVDDHEGEAGLRARVGLARLLLRAGRHGEAARSLQEAIERKVDDEMLAQSMRELSMRRLLGAVAPGPSAAPASPGAYAGVRSPSGFAVDTAGRVMIGDAKTGRVMALEPRGRLDQWELVGLQALAVGPFGGTFAAAGRTVYRLDPGGRVAALVSLGSAGQIGDMAVDGTRGFWLLERRGQRVWRIEPGASGPTLFWEDRTARLVSIAWDGRRVIGVDTKARRLIAIEPGGRTLTLLAQGLDKPVAVAADPSGRLALLDARSGFVSMVSADGSRLAAYAYIADGIERPVTLAFGTDGALYLYDQASMSWMRRP